MLIFTSPGILVDGKDETGEKPLHAHASSAIPIPIVEQHAHDEPVQAKRSSATIQRRRRRPSASFRTQVVSQGSLPTPTLSFSPILPRSQKTLTLLNMHLETTYSITKRQKESRTSIWMPRTRPAKLGERPLQRGSHTHNRLEPRTRKKHHPLYTCNYLRAGSSLCHNTPKLSATRHAHTKGDLFGRHPTAVEPTT